MRRLRAAFWAALALAVTAASANAQLLTFVSATGADGRPCTVQTQPCRTLDRAIDATTAGGEIRLLSSLPNQTATIDKSLTVDGAGHTMIGAITINAGSGVVTLRDLSLNGRNTNGNGIEILNAAVVHIENCTVERYTTNGIQLANNLSTELFVSDSVARDNGNAGLVAFGQPTATLTIENSRFENNTWFGIRVDAGTASVADSVAASNDIGMFQMEGTMNIARSTAAANRVGFESDGGDMTLESSVARGNTEYGVFSAGTTMRISNSVVTNNPTGVNTENTVPLTLGNNLIAGNTTIDVDGPPLTPLAAQ